MLMENFIAIGVLRNAVVNWTQANRAFQATFTTYSPSFILPVQCTTPHFWRISLAQLPWNGIARCGLNKVRPCLRILGRAYSCCSTKYLTNFPQMTNTLKRTCRGIPCISDSINSWLIIATIEKLKEIKGEITLWGAIACLTHRN